MVFAAIAGLTLGVLAVPAPAPADAASAWSDEFDAPRDTPVDASKWMHELGAGGWGNNELQTYTDSTRDSAHDGDGNLVIAARQDSPGVYSSARLVTSRTFSQTYGRVEARIKVPRGQGIWPAFWMLGSDLGSVGWPNSGEIDVMENIGREPNTVYGTVHGPGYSGAEGITGSRNIGRALADDFHVYGIEWAPDSIRWFLDGREYHRVTPASLGGDRWVFDKPFFLILNVAVGGNWPGYPDASTQFPQQMLVDWVRTAPTSAPPPPAPASGDSIVSEWHGKCVDVQDFRFEDGQRLIVWSCTGGSNQRWRFVDGTVRSENGMCMDVAWGSRDAGAAIQLARCSGSGAQRFVLSGAGDLVNPQADKCVDIAGWNAQNDAVLQLWTCTGGENQKWRRG